MQLEATAPAKINLALHVVGRRPDGMHELDSLVAFAQFGDRISVADAACRSLQVSGPMARDVPCDKSNLVWRAAGLLGGDRGARIVIEKMLPNSAGIGGGSSDAATTLRLLSRLWNRPLPDSQSTTNLGADIPVCLFGHSARMRGIGEVIEPVSHVPAFHIVLINPGISVVTSDVFSRLSEPLNAPLTQIPDTGDAYEFAGWLSAQRNDLETAAVGLAPEISDVIGCLSDQEDCALARMSGSGATCFGLFANSASVFRAAAKIKRQCPHWWVQATRLAAIGRKHSNRS